MSGREYSARVLLSAWLAIAACPLLVSASDAPPSLGSITFEDRRARASFDDYVAFLERDPAKFAPDLATLRQLQGSNVQYHVEISAELGLCCGGKVTTDGQRVLVCVSNRGGPFGEAASLNSRFAHEFEHARQVDDGELGFQKSPHLGRWIPVSYDIGDEMKAWSAQFRASVAGDTWRKPMGKPAEPTLLLGFATARTDADRAAVLVRAGYKNLRAAGTNVVFPVHAGYAVGQVVRPSTQYGYFGRVHNLCRD